VKVACVTDSLQSRLDKLEILYSEQDYTIQTLNELVAQQDREVARLTHNLEQLQQQLQTLRSELSGDTDSADQPPPHY
jgi:SlyX protein